MPALGRQPAWFYMTEYDYFEYRNLLGAEAPIEGFDRYALMWARWLADDLAASGTFRQVRYTTWQALAEDPRPDYIVAGAIIAPTGRCSAGCIQLWLLRPDQPRETLWARDYDIVEILKATPGSYIVWGRFFDAENIK
ncbi:MAG TPA: hypothetical protein DD417_01155, partial [Elusimicrobia bacterium]|nr:hypothetical protein [Elusimicrobiota bacterium]